MRKSAYPKVLRRGVAGLVILLLLLLLLGAFAPAAMAADDWPNCDWIQDTSCDEAFPEKKCVSQDGEITKAWLGNCTTDAELEPCTLGTSVEACVWIEFGPGPKRYQIYSFFDLYIGGNYEGKKCNCNDSLPQQTGATLNVYGPFQWECGQEVELKNILVTWSVDKDCNCSDPACCDKKVCECDHLHPKCWYGGNITLRAPLVANFTFDNVCFCTNTTFTDNTTGGKKPYSYDWDFDDGNSSNAQNPTHHYGKNGTYNVTLTVTDGDTPQNTSSQSYDVTVYQNPTADAGPDKSICAGDSVVIGGSPTASGGTLPTLIVGLLLLI
jgi:hypothetical protein